MNIINTAVARNWIEDQNQEEILEIANILAHHEGVIDLQDLECLLTGGDYKLTLKFLDDEIEFNKEFVEDFIREIMLASKKIQTRTSATQKSAPLTFRRTVTKDLVELLSEGNTAAQNGVDCGLDWALYDAPFKALCKLQQHSQKHGAPESEDELHIALGDGSEEELNLPPIQDNAIFISSFAISALGVLEACCETELELCKD